MSGRDPHETATPEDLLRLKRPQPFRRLAERLPTAIWTTDRALRVTAQQGRALSLVHRAFADVTGKLLTNLMGDTENERRAIECHQNALRGVPGTCELHWGGRPFRAHIEPLRDDAGAIIGCLGVALDITEQRQAEQARLESETSYWTLMEQASDAITLSHPDGSYVMVNTRACEMFGYPRTELLRMRPLDLVVEEDIPAVLDSRERLQAGEQFLLEVRIRRKDGAVVPVEISAKMLPNGLTQGILRDVTRRKKAEEDLRADARFRRALNTLTREALRSGLDETFYQRLLDQAVQVIPGAQAGSLLVRDEQDDFRYVAATPFDLACLQQVVFDAHELPACTEPYLVTDRDNRDLGHERRALLQQSGPSDRIQATLAVPVLFDGDTMALFNLDSFDHRDAFTPDAIEMARIFGQQTAALLHRFRLEHKLQQERTAFEHMALHDPVTELPNRTYFKLRLEECLAVFPTDGVTPAILLLDLDEFKLINDAHGHAFGDQVIRAVAHRLRSALRGAHTLARWGGDEFIVLLPDASTPDEVRRVAYHLLTLLTTPLTVAGRSVSITGSIGISVSSPEASTEEELLKRADIALYRAKGEGKNTLAFFRQEMDQRLRERLALEADLREALDQQALTLHFQPRVDLRTLRITSVEALARWRHPERGFVSPAVFIPLAEETGLIHQLGRQVLHMACRQASAWQQQGIEVRVAVNRSAAELKQEDFVAQVRSVLEHYGLSGRSLELEITESAAMEDVEDSIVKLAEVRSLGVEVAVDDFGTAYSSLAYLQRLPLDSLKIDQSFVRDLGPVGSNEAVIVQTIVALARNLGLTVIAEGVETGEQRDFLDGLQCDEAQGFLFSRPLPGREIEELLRAGPLDV